ncbi:YciI family protein [Paracoccus sp. ME4]|uniref:YciI family protein n=1 Tax=Paracoccus sp. ME4 TaxID=3138066 RepID=UPI00398AF5DA
MPLFAVICRDNPGALQTRLDTREAHLAHIRDSGIVAMAGPLIEDGEMRGSLVILDCADRGAAQAWAEADPYRAAGLFRDVQVTEWKKVIG